MKTHDLKIHPEHFKAVCEGSKKAELRVNDRDYKVGDLLLLREYFPETKEYSGHVTKQRVTHIINCDKFITDKGIVVLSMETSA